MATPQNRLFGNVHQNDTLKFYSNHGVEYNRIAEFLDLDKNALSKIGGVSKQSVRFDNKIPRDLKDRLEQIANIINMVAGYFEADEYKTALWFKTPNPSLGEISPRDMIRLGRYKKLLKFVIEAREANPDSGG
jgi:uncharacterized protein (DUF2384 family)